MIKKFFLLVIIICILTLSANAFGTGINLMFNDEETTVSSFGSFNGNRSQGMLPFFKIRNIKNSNPITFYNHYKGILIAKINTQKVVIEPYVSKNLVTSKDVFDKLEPLLVVNAGFFDGNNGKSVSYVVKNGITIANPEENDNLYSNPILCSNMDKILNRAEFRILKKSNDLKYDIALHNSPVQQGWDILHSIQAGPMLLPYNSSVEEFFVKYNEQGELVRDAISVTRKTARTAIGIKDNDVYIIIATREMPLTIEALAQLCKTLGLEKAMGFDGGGSTSLDTKNIHITSEKDGTARKVKSFLIVNTR